MNDLLNAAAATDKRDCNQQRLTKIVVTFVFAKRLSIAEDVRTATMRADNAEPFRFSKAIEVTNRMRVRNVAHNRT